MRKGSPRGPYKMLKTAEQLFWEKVDKSGECWIWLAARKGGRCKQKYGSFIVGGRLHKKQWYAHRYSYFLVHGSIPDDLDILHSCDNGLCVNPGHLRAGTPYENMQDAIRRDRLKPYDRRGEKNSRATFTDQEVIQIKQSIAQGVKVSAIARLLSVPENRISAIKCGYSWDHINL
jgi:hypothetical protein